MAGESDNGERGRTVVVSAPGKVLLAGGYIVLHRQHTGLVFGLSARIHVVAQQIPASEGGPEIVVQSPQFLNATWRYRYQLVENDGSIKVSQVQADPPVEPNHFVETALNYVLSYIAHAANIQSVDGLSPASLLILADNDYYSEPKQPIPSEGGNKKEPVPRFRSLGTTLKDAHKTGLGSSAALVTSLTAALLSHYLPRRLFDLDSADGKRILHNLAQVVHCVAQRKVGSGFDVAAAVYGSCVYRRFSPSLLQQLPGDGGPGNAGFASAVFRLVGGGKWDCEVRKDEVGLPPGVAIRMCDVDCGTETVGMVKTVQEWARAFPGPADEAFQGLQGWVDSLARVLRERQTAQIGPVMGLVREIMRKLGRDSGAPIEPESQERMLNELEKVPGVYGTVVPGAGGYDAAAVVMRDDEETERKVEEFLKRWSREKNIQVRLMQVRGETQGVRKEDVEEFRAWMR
ncbi:hypothetical protein VTK56DRAFT_764 [Thermocarpiscus australiensis]